MKFVITEEQSRRVVQSKVDKGPLSDSIIRLIDLIDSPMIDKHTVAYVEKYNEYLVILWPKSGYYLNSEFCWKLSKRIRQFIPATMTIFSAPES
jgi:hypothetical protein